MERLIKAQRAIQLVVTTALVAGTQYQQDSIIPYLRRVLGDSASGWAVYGLALLLIGVVFHLIGVAADTFLERATWARRLVLREQFVEGQWADVVVGPNDELTGGIVDIFYRNGELQVSGTTYDRLGRRIGPFFSKHSMFCDNDLIYIYTKDPQALARSPSLGFGTYTFQPCRWRSPTEFNGFFSSRQSSQDYRVHGRKIEGRPLRSDEECGRYVSTFLAKYEYLRAREEDAKTAAARA